MISPDDIPQQPGIGQLAAESHGPNGVNEGLGTASLSETMRQL